MSEQPDSGGKAAGDGKYYENQPYDIEMDLGHEEEDEEKDEKEEKEEQVPNNLINQNQQISGGEEEEQYQEVKETPPVTKSLPKFDISKFEELSTTPEIKELYQMMQTFTPYEMPLDSKLKPFIPSYLPAIGEVDAFLKVNRPDYFPEELGLNVMDEPTSQGVDKYILEMELAETTKCKIDKFSVKSISDAEKKPNEITDWINKIGDLQKRKVPTVVQYQNKMPDIEGLMQVWPEKEENCGKAVPFPDEKMNISLQNYSKIVCNLLDIPVHKKTGDKSKNLIESLHVGFTGYSGFKDNAHFQNIKEEENNKDFQSLKF